MKYCAYQERSQSEVRNKLKSLKVYYEIIEQVIAELINQDFLNEERFARAYARGKFNINGWGKRKIIAGLKHKDLTKQCIILGLSEIDDQFIRINSIKIW